MMKSYAALGACSNARSSLAAARGFVLRSIVTKRNVLILCITVVAEIPGISPWRSHSRTLLGNVLRQFISCRASANFIQESYPRTLGEVLFALAFMISMASSAASSALDVGEGKLGLSADGATNEIAPPGVYERIS